jgi:hypothetical protein
MAHVSKYIAAASLGLISIAPAFAQSPAYRAVPVAVASNATVIADGVLWRCGDAGCTATNATSRPAVVCAQAVRKVGKLTSFTVGTVAFDEAALAKCNAKAKA